MQTELRSIHLPVILTSMKVLCVNKISVYTYNIKELE